MLDSFAGNVGSMSEDNLQDNSKRRIESGDTRLEMLHVPKVFVMKAAHL